MIAEAQDGTTTVEYAYLDGEPLVMWRNDATGDPQPPETDTPPGKAVLMSPILQVEISTGSPTLEWEQDPLASEYRLRVYDKGVGAWVYNEIHQSDSVCSEGVCSYAPAIVLNQSINHRWRVQAQNVVGSGDWSDNGLSLIHI